ncbi:MAG TPA: ComEC/Rec2 family competence protein, partial [Tepidiformaceae bacterium]|nr:ComEC/Rec2 family competence protein [Tepidiformaceae bacterium]
MTLILLAAGWLAGIAAVALWDSPWWTGASLIAGCIAGVAAWRGPRGIATIGAAMVVAALAGGFLFARWDGRGTPDAAGYLGRTVTFAGTMATEPDTGDTSASYVVNVRQVRTRAGWVETAGRIRVSLGQYTRYLPGDQVQLTGKLEAAPVFDDFDYRAYLARQDIVGTMYRPNVVLTAAASSTSFHAVVARARLRLDGALQRALPEPVASLADGIAFGRDGGMPDDLYADFRATGLAHIVAVSGSNVSVLGALAFALLIPVMGRRWAVLPAGLLVATYVVMAGASASVVRAGIMAAILLVGEWIGRPQSGLPGLAGAIVVMTAVQPSAALDVGFQLSVAATAGLIAFGPWVRYLLERWVRRGWGLVLPAWSIEAAAITLAATSATLPLLWVNFGRVSLVSPLANVIVTPAVLLALPLAMATAVAGAISAPFGWLLGLVTYYPVAFVISVARGLASVPGASIATPGVNGTVAAIAMLALGAAGWLCYRG